MKRLAARRKAWQRGERPITAQEARLWAAAHWRPAFEIESALAFGVGAVAALALGATGAVHAALMLPAAGLLGFAAASRAKDAKRILTVRARLWGEAPSRFTLADLVVHMRRLAPANDSGHDGATRARLTRLAYSPLRRTKALERAERAAQVRGGAGGVRFDAALLPPVKGLWLGLGFEWGSAEAQLASMLPSRDWVHSRAPEALVPFLRNGKKGLGRRIGSPVLHGIGPEERPLDISFDEMGAGTLIVGTTGAGKGVLLANLISQAVLRGDVVVVIDPKFSEQLYRAVCKAAEAAGRRAPFLLHPSKPEASVRLDPLANFQRPSEIASRLRDVIGSHAKEFADLSWAAANRVVEALLLIEELPTLATIEKYVSIGLEDVLEKIFERALDAGWGRAAGEDAEESLYARRPAGRDEGDVADELLQKWEQRAACEDGYDWRKEADVLLEELQKTHGPGREARLCALNFIWERSVAEPRFRAKVKRVLGNNAIDRVRTVIAACEPRTKEQTAKVTGSLRTALAKLSGDALGPLLSPDPADPADTRPVTTLAKVVRGGDMLYVGLDSLTDAAVAEALGMLLLSDLTSLAGELYNRGESGQSARKISLFVDETSNVINQPLLELLNKGREAGIQTTCAMQTTADLEAMLGSRAKALQALGNLNNVIALRTIDADTQRFVEALLGRSLREETGRSKALTREEALLGDVRLNASESATLASAPLIDGDRLRELPNLEFFASVGGRLYKGRSLFLDPECPTRQLFNALGELAASEDASDFAAARVRAAFSNIRKRFSTFWQGAAAGFQHRSNRRPTGRKHD